MRSIFTGSFLAVAMAATSLPAMAEGELDGLPGELSANVAFVNDYRFRGITQSDEDPAVQGGLDYSAELTEGFGLYIGAWGSSVDFNDGDEASIEIDYYAGFTKTLGPVDLSLGGVYYTYPGASDALNYDYFEIAATAGVSPIENFSLTAGYNYSPEYFGESGEYHYPSASFEYAIPLKTPIALTLGGSIGYNMIEDEATFGVTDDYTDWSLSLSANYNILNLSVAYVDNDEPGTIGDAAFIFTVGASF